MESVMATMVAQMTKGELEELLETIVERKLLELLGDPYEGLSIRKSIRDRLLRQKQRVVAGERGEPFEDVIQNLGLE
jgi:hypothetical protein